MINKYRTHNCGGLSEKNIGEEIKISGWLHSKRDHGGIIFLDIRDFFGVTQVVLEENLEITKKISHVKLESVLTILGKVSARNQDSVNQNISTGAIEIVASEVIIESESVQIPFQINDSNLTHPEELLMKYRFLDLRREEMKNYMVLRSQVIHELRNQMVSRGFMEFQTPILTASSPEGARDYLVPSRIHKGKFYALPQAPQQFKQLLMVSGFHRYFQIAPCFRDEDLRSDRSPEFYQLDLEMSFVTQEDVFNTIEPVIRGIFEKFGKKRIADAQFPRIKYKDSMLKYGNDKPDLRNPIEICDVTEDFSESDFTIFANAIGSGAKVRAIPAPKSSAKPRSFFDKMIEFAIANGAKGLGYIAFDDAGAAKGPVAKFLNESQIESIIKKSGITREDAVFFSCGDESQLPKITSLVRTKIGEELGLIDENIFKFCWIVDYPMFERDDDTGKIGFSHNPFSMPQGGMDALLNEDPTNVIAYQYDVVCNGVELSSGAIRNHKPEILYKAFEIAGYSKEHVEEKFSAMVNAFKFGAPPHGGIAPGIERMLMLILDEKNIRKVIPFPMNGKGEDLMMNAPSEVTLQQLKELGISVKL